jgi:hypothetical protein
MFLSALGTMCLLVSDFEGPDAETVPGCSQAKRYSKNVAKKGRAAGGHRPLGGLGPLRRKMVQSKLSGPVRRACQAQENDHNEYCDARDNDHEHPRRFRIARTNAAILPRGPACVNGTRVTLASVLMYRVLQAHALQSGRAKKHDRRTGVALCEGRAIERVFRAC